MKTTKDAGSTLIEIFVEECQTRITEMRENLWVLESHQDDAKAIGELMLRFHSIAGIGGIEGIDLMNLLASRGESECRALIRTGTVPTTVQLRLWTAVVELMAVEVDQISRNAPSFTMPVSQQCQGKPRILAVEDVAVQAEYIRLILEPVGYVVRSCADAADFEAELTSFNPDLILMDILLPGASGYELARLARQRKEHATTPILFLTSQSHLQSRIETLRCGGDDHLVKPISPPLLLAAIETRLERARAVTASIEQDSLTGLLNRGALQKRLHSATRRVSEGGQAALIMIDVDHFKSINDTYGHPAGDRVLTNLASYLQQHVGPEDVVSRYGGEEFVIVVQNVDEGEALQFAARLVRNFAATRQSVSGGEILVTFSAGVAAVPAAVSGLPECLRAADMALYRAKAAGRNAAMGASPRMVPFAPASLNAGLPPFGAVNPPPAAMSSTAS
jgi:diguanylate cyclase (GGDEF)-like protein